MGYPHLLGVLAVLVLHQASQAHLLFEPVVVVAQVALLPASVVWVEVVWAPEVAELEQQELPTQVVVVVVRATRVARVVLAW